MSRHNAGVHSFAFYLRLQTNPPSPLLMSTNPTPGLQIVWGREALAGLASTLAVVAVPITLGILVYSPLGASAGPLGIPAAFWTVVIGGTVGLLLSNAGMPALGPTSATALILALLIGRIAGDPLFDSTDSSHLAALVAVASSAVALMGLLILLFGIFRLGGLITYVPRPVLSGFMNGVALMIIVSQLPSLTGVAIDAWQAAPLQSLVTVQPATVAIGAATLAIAWLISRLRPGWPVSLVALVGGTLLYHAVAQWFPQLALGGLTGQLPETFPTPVALFPSPDVSTLFERHWQAILSTGLVLAVIASLESLLNVAAVDLQTHHRTDPNRDLRAVGIANVVGAFFGSLPGLQVRIRAMAILQFGGQTKVASLFSAVGAFALLGIAAPLVALLPRSVLAAVMISIAFALIDRWSMQLIRRLRAGDRTPDLLPNLLVVLAVLLVTLFAGFAAAVGLGIVLSMVLFIRSVNRGLIRSRWLGEDHHSRRIYLPSQEDALRTRRRQIEGIEVEGVLYFGSERRLVFETDQLRPETRFLIVDLHRVSTMEASGVTFLSQLAQRLAMRGVQLMIAGPQAEPRRAIGAFGSPQLIALVHGDADRAMEAAERQLLQEAGVDSDASVPLENSLLLDGFTAEEIGRVRALFVPRSLAAGERLFAQGDSGDALYVVSRGSIGLLSGASAEERNLPQHRFLSASPGMMLGELAVLDRQGRTTDAVAEAEALVYQLPAVALEILRRDEPGLAAQLLLNIAIHLSQRLRAAAGAWREDAA